MRALQNYLLRVLLAVCVGVALHLWTMSGEPPHALAQSCPVGYSILQSIALGGTNPLSMSIQLVQTTDYHYVKATASTSVVTVSSTLDGIFIRTNNPSNAFFHFAQPSGPFSFTIGSGTAITGILCTQDPSSTLTPTTTSTPTALPPTSTPTTTSTPTAIPTVLLAFDTTSVISATTGVGQQLVAFTTDATTSAYFLALAALVIGMGMLLFIKELMTWHSGDE